MSRLTDWLNMALTLLTGSLYLKQTNQAAKQTLFKDIYGKELRCLSSLDNYGVSCRSRQAKKCI